MAWSEKARAAAAEVRRLHAEAKAKYPQADYRKARGWDVARVYSPADRRAISLDIRAARAMVNRGKLGQLAQVKGTLRANMDEAAVSTATRNFLKRRR